MCGDGVCGGSDHRNQIEDCHSCPQDCGACGTPNCGNGQCQYGETWAPRVRQMQSLTHPISRTKIPIFRLESIPLI